MDERTRTTGDDVAPNLRRTAPAPDVKSQMRRRVGLGVIAILLALAAYQVARWMKSTPAGGDRFPQGAAQSVGAATVGSRRYPRHRQRARHRHADRHRHRANPDQTVNSSRSRSPKARWSRRATSWRKSIASRMKSSKPNTRVSSRAIKGLLAQAQLDLTRYQTLAQQNSIARQQAEDQVFIVQQDEGTVKLDQALVDAQALNITYCHIVSPVTGRVGLRLVDPGNYVQTTTSTGLAVVTQMQPITVIFAIPEDDLPGDHAAIERRHLLPSPPMTAPTSTSSHRSGHRRRQSDRHHHRDRESARAIRQPTTRCFRANSSTRGFW
jgi:hypothetical protein